VEGGGRDGGWVAESAFPIPFVRAGRRRGGRGAGPRLAVACPEEEGLSAGGGGGGVGGRVGEADHHAECGRVPPPWPALAAASSASRVEAHPAARLKAHGDLGGENASFGMVRGVRRAAGLTSMMRLMRFSNLSLRNHESMSRCSDGDEPCSDPCISKSRLIRSHAAADKSGKGSVAPKEDPEYSFLLPYPKSCRLCQPSF
jgi:hypothetical protein